jgi:hypothetical protein
MWFIRKRRREAEEELMKARREAEVVEQRKKEIERLGHAVTGRNDILIEDLEDAFRRRGEHG